MLGAKAALAAAGRVLPSWAAAALPPAGALEAVVFVMYCFW